VSNRAPARWSQDIGPFHPPGHHHPEGVDEQVAFAPVDPFVPVKTANPAALGGLDRLAIQDDDRRAHRPTTAQARLLMKRPLEFGQDARLFPGAKVMVNGARAREFAGQEAPLATGTQQVKDRVEDGAQVGGARPSAGPCGRQVRGDPGPGGVAEVGVVDAGAHGWRNGPDEPCFAREGGNFSNIL
jgi:hypothetical protein